MPSVQHHFLSGSDSLDGDGSRLASVNGVVQQSRAPSKFFQQSSRQLEEMLAQRLEKEALHRSGAGRKGSSGAHQSSAVTATTTCAAPSPLPVNDTAATSVQKLLNDEMKRHCRIIQEKHLIERKRPQQLYDVAGGPASKIAVGAAVGSIDEEVVG